MGVKLLRFDYILLVVKNIIKCYCTDTDRAIVFTKFETIWIQFTAFPVYIQ